jgi:hypothetical protein
LVDAVALLDAETEGRLELTPETLVDFLTGLADLSAVYQPGTPGVSPSASS